MQSQKISSSIRLSFTGSHVEMTTKQSRPRTSSSSLTSSSPSGNDSSAPAPSQDRSASQTFSARSLAVAPAKTLSSPDSMTRLPVAARRHRGAKIPIHRASCSGVLIAQHVLGGTASITSTARRPQQQASARPSGSTRPSARHAPRARAPRTAGRANAVVARVDLADRALRLGRVLVLDDPLEVGPTRRARSARTPTGRRSARRQRRRGALRAVRSSRIRSVPPDQRAVAAEHEARRSPGDAPRSAASRTSPRAPSRAARPARELNRRPRTLERLADECPLVPDHHHDRPHPASRHASTTAQTIGRPPTGWQTLGRSEFPCACPCRRRG